jgi:hypothetical protein
MSAPIVAADLFRTVVAAAGGRCWCTGQCGNTHRATEGRCIKTHDIAGVRLIAAPADPTTGECAAVGLPAAALRAWCPPCFSAAQRAARKAAAAAVSSSDQRGLFDI